jgi:putative DNA primase/helicase
MTEAIKSLAASDLPSPSSNGHQDLEEAKRLTDEDLAQHFTALVQQALLEPDPKTGELQHWITVNGQSFRWVGNHYEAISTSSLRRRIVEISRVAKLERKGVELHPFMKPRFIEEAFKWIQQLTERDPSEINPDGLINCRNGVLRIDWDGRTPKPALVPHDPAIHLFTDPPGLIYKPDASTAEAERLLQCIPDQSRPLLLECIGASFAVRTIRAFGHRIPALLLIGDGENGKDTLRQVITWIHGDSSVALISIRDWQQYERGDGRGRFSVSQLGTARLSIGSENSGAFKLDNLENLKAAITGEPIYIEGKGTGGNRVIPRALMLWFLNSMPLLDGGTNAVLSRYGVINLPFSYSTKPRPGQLQADPRFKHDPEWMADHVLPGLLNLAIAGLARAAQQGFSLESVADSLQALREETCHLHQFLRDEGYEKGDPTDYELHRTIWDSLQRWYQENGWMIQNTRTGDWELAFSDSGDKPIRAPKDLVKRLRQVLPAATSIRLPDASRAAVIHGIRRRRTSDAAGRLPPNQPEIMPPTVDLDF